MEINYNAVTNNFEFYVDGTLLTSYSATDGTDSYDGLDAVIFDNFNYATNNPADDYSVNWTGFKTGLSLPGSPTNLHFMSNSNAIACGSTVNTTFSNSLNLVWDDPSGTITHHRTLISYPDHTSKLAYTDSRNVWIGNIPRYNIYNGFGEHGDGTYTYSVQAEDAQGLWGTSASCSLIFDTTGPVIAVASPSSPYVSNRNDIVVSGTAIDNLSGIGANVVRYGVTDSTTGSLVSSGTSPVGKNGSWSFTIARNSLTDGHHIILSVAARDNVNYPYGNIGSAHTYFIVDNTPPSTPEITAPGARTWHSTTPIVDTWTAASDKLSGISHYQIAYNYDDGHSFGSSTCPGVTIAGYSGFIGCRDVNGTSRGHVPGPNEQGGVTIWVRAIDGAGNASPWSTPVHYYYDHTAPTNVGVTFPADGTIARSTNGTLTVTGTALDNLFMNRVGVQLIKPGVSGQIAYVYANDNKMVYTNPGTWQATFDTNALKLSDGTYGINVYATDMAGNTTVKHTTFTLDNTAPSTTLVGPVNNVPVSYTKNNTVTISGTIKELHPSHYWFMIYGPNGQQLSGAALGTHYYSNPAGTDTYDFSYDWNLKGLASGRYEIVLSARDAVGGTLSSGNKDAGSTSSIYVNVDNTAPAIGITGTSQSELNTVSFNGYVNDPDFAYYYCWLTATPNGPEIANTRGANCVTTWAKSLQRNGNPATPTDQGAGSSTSPLALGSFDVTGLATGTYTIHLVAVDSAGNHSAAASYDVTVDHTKPNVMVNNYSGYDSTPSLSGSVDDPTATATVMVAIDGGTPEAAVVQGGTWNYTVNTPLAVGTHTVEVTATDPFGNVSTADGTATINTVATPTVLASLQTPANPGSQPAGGNQANGQNTSQGTNQNSSLANQNDGGHVLGDSTATPASTDNANGNVKGYYTVHNKVASLAAKHSGFLGLGWWWLAVLAALVAFFGYLFVRSGSNQASDRS